MWDVLVRSGMAFVVRMTWEYCLSAAASTDRQTEKEKHIFRY